MAGLEQSDGQEELLTEMIVIYLAVLMLLASGFIVSRETFLQI